MELTYRILQRPESDILGWTSSNLIVEDGVRKLHHIRNKTKIALPDNVIQRLDQAPGTDEQRKVVKPAQPLGHRLIGKRET
jgi:hypothetical protein